jgi:hypothetical protein
LVVFLRHNGPVFMLTPRQLQHRHPPFIIVLVLVLFILPGATAQDKEMAAATAAVAAVELLSVKELREHAHQVGATAEEMEDAADSDLPKGGAYTAIIHKKAPAGQAVEFATSQQPVDWTSPTGAPAWQ